MGGRSERGWLRKRREERSCGGGLITFRGGRLASSAALPGGEKSRGSRQGLACAPFPTHSARLAKMCEAHGDNDHSLVDHKDVSRSARCPASPKCRSPKLTRSLLGVARRTRTTRPSSSARYVRLPSLQTGARTTRRGWEACGEKPGADGKGGVESCQGDGGRHGEASQAVRRRAQVQA